MQFVLAGSIDARLTQPISSGTPWPGSLGVWCQVCDTWDVAACRDNAHDSACDAAQWKQDALSITDRIAQPQAGEFEQVRLVGWQLAAWLGHGKTCLLCLFAARLNSDDKAGISTLR